MPKSRLIRLTVALTAALAYSAAIHAQTPEPAAGVAAPQTTATDTPETAPVTALTLDFSQLADTRDNKLFGIHNQQEMQFTLRRDHLATDAVLHLVFTPSPALLPKVSHIRVYLNDEMMGAIPIATDPPGQRQSHDIKLDPAFLSTYNRIRLEFVGHYTEVCENLAHSSLWLDISKQTRLQVQQQMLPLADDLSFFPEPFLDANDMLPQELPFVFSGAPSPTVSEAAALLASYMGARARWRDVSFPVSYGQLPDGHAIVFATNADRPAFLRDYPPVEQPVVAMMSAPEHPYNKLLLVLGRDDNDLKTAATALALGGPLLRGSSVQVENITPLAPRRPYDAPNWIPTDRAVPFAQLVEYPGQLEVQGMRPRPIRLNLNIPPDLFVWRSNGIPMDLIYRYTPPAQRDESRLILSLNERLVASYPLEPTSERSGRTQMRLQVVGQDVSDTATLRVPALRIGAQNQLGMDFSFATVAGNASVDSCRTTLPVDVRAAIDERSSIDFSGYPHYIEMPNLGVFANSGLPFSRLADLSETVVVMPAQATPAQLSVLLQTAGLISAHTGYPAYRLTVVNDWKQASQREADLLWIGETPEAFRDRPDANLLLNHTRASLTQPLRGLSSPGGLPAISYLPDVPHASDPAVRLSMRGTAPIAAIVGMESPFFAKRSMVGLLATSTEDYALLQQALRDSGKRDAMRGSVAIIRASGVASERVGPRYFVGELHWWQRVWYHFSDRPWILGAVAAVAVLLISLLLWLMLKWVARKRLGKDA